MSIWWIVFGIIFLLLGIGMIVGSIVWNRRSTLKIWTNTMIALLAFGVVISVIGIILIVIGSIRREVPGVPRRKVPLIIQRNKKEFYLDSKTKTYQPSDIIAFRSKCNNMTFDELLSAIDRDPLYRDHCIDILQQKQQYFIDPATGVSQRTDVIRSNCKNMTYDELFNNIDNPVYREVCMDILSQKQGSTNTINEIHGETLS